MQDVKKFFESLFGLQKEKFLSEFYGESPYHVKSSMDSVLELITWRDINKIVSSNLITSPRLRLYRAGHPIPESAYSRTVELAGPAKRVDIEPSLFKMFVEGGATLVIDAVDELNDRVDKLTVGLEREFGVQLQANLYAVLGKEGGFDIHWDDHDVVAVQVSGVKEWQIYAPTRAYPVKDDVERPPIPDAEPDQVVLMMPGDVLYLPRGWWHRVVSQGESIHVTYGFGRIQQLEILQVLRRRLCELTTFRKDFPSHVTHDRANEEDCLDQLKVELKECIEKISIDDIWRFFDSARSTRTVVDISATNNLLPTHVVRNWRVKPYVGNSGSKYQVSFRGKTLISPIDFRSLMDKLDLGEPVLVSEIYSELSRFDNDIDVSAMQTLLASMKKICMIV